MSSFRRLAALPLAKGLVALLAVLLASAGGLRLGSERSGTSLAEEDRAPAVCLVHTGSAAYRAGLVNGQVAWGTERRSISDGTSQPAPLADHLVAPSLLLGSAGGPRAP
jgi:hypothetical protein